MGVFYMKKTARDGKVATKVATQEEEVTHDKKHGWEEFDPNAKASETLTLKKPEGKQAAL